MNKQAIIVAGPTGSGKTSFAIKLAKEINGEIINADSRQVYRGFPIGTNKGKLSPTAEFISLGDQELQAYELDDSGVIGWLFNICDAKERFDVSRFYYLAGQVMEIIAAAGKVPVIVGGTGLYIDALVKGYQLPKAKPDNILRTRLNNLTALELLDELTKLNPAMAERMNQSDRHNPRRLVRAIEIASQKTPDQSEDQKLIETKELLSQWKFNIYYPLYERANLFARIDQRVIEMFDQGLVAETKQALEDGYANSEILNGIGYKQVRKFLKGEITEPEAIAAVQQAHRNYAKRQITWFESGGRDYKLIRQAFNV